MVSQCKEDTKHLRLCASAASKAVEQQAVAAFAALPLLIVPKTWQLTLADTKCGLQWQPQHHVVAVGGPSSPAHL